MDQQFYFNKIERLETVFNIQLNYASIHSFVIPRYSQTYLIFDFVEIVSTYDWTIIMVAR